MTVTARRRRVTIDMTETQLHAFLAAVVAYDGNVEGVAAFQRDLGEERALRNFTQSITQAWHEAVAR